MFHRTPDQEAQVRAATYWRRSLVAAVKSQRPASIHSAILAAPDRVDVVVDLEAAVIDANTSIGEVAQAWREWATKPTSRVPVCEIDRIHGLLSTQAMFSMSVFDEPGVGG